MFTWPMATNFQHWAMLTSQLIVDSSLLIKGAMDFKVFKCLGLLYCMVIMMNEWWNNLC